MNTECEGSWFKLQSCKSVLWKGCSRTEKHVHWASLGLFSAVCGPTSIDNEHLQLTVATSLCYRFVSDTCLSSRKLRKHVRWGLNHSTVENDVCLLYILLVKDWYRAYTAPLELTLYPLVIFTIVLHLSIFIIWAHGYVDLLFGWWRWPFYSIRGVLYQRGTVYGEESNPTTGWVVGPTTHCWSYL